MLSLDDFEVEITFAGHKSSEGDGKTAADIKRELAATQEEEDADGSE